MTKKIIYIGLILLTGIVYLASCKDDEGTNINPVKGYDESKPTLLVGYCQNTYSSLMGSETETTMGAAIKMDTILKDKGNQLVAVRIGIAPSIIGQAGEVRISKYLKSKPIYTQAFITRGTGWEYIKLDKPYDLNEEDTIYISYVTTGKGQIIAYQNTGIANSNSDFAMLNGQWFHLSSASITGQVCIQAVLTGKKEMDKTYDLSLGSLQYPRYIEQGKEDSLTVVVTNYGTGTLDGCILTYEDDKRKEDISIQEKLTNGRSVRCAIRLTQATEGERSFTIKVRPADSSIQETNLNNNTIESVQDVYGNSFKRILLLEQFTGQGCMYCPSGEENLHNIIGDSIGRIAWVAHHVGFGEDNMTIPASNNYTWFYNSASTYAPAVMLNRSAISWKGLLQPVFSSFDLKKEDVLQLLAEPAHMSVNINRSYNGQSGDLNITVSGVSLAKDIQSRLTVFLVQNGITAYQERGGENYTHNSVVRACLTDVWGDPVTFNSDGNYNMSYFYRIPATIGSIDTDADQMYIVAFIADYNPENMNDCKVRNANFISIK